MGHPSRLEHLPITFFAVVMGLSGFALAWEKAHVLFGSPLLIAVVLGGISMILFLGLAGLYVLKLIRYPQQVVGELNHPVKLSFFPAVSIGLILLGTCMLDPLPGIGLVLWAIGTAAHLAFTLYVMGAWINHQKFRINHINPAWFIPVVGNILVPIAGVPLGFVDISWFFFSIGIVFWLVLLTIFFNRIIFHDPLPDRLVPTFFILIAPPAVGCIAWFKLVGEIDAFAHVLYNVALFFGLLLVSQLAKFARLPFFLSWWAYSFPLAAITIATMLMYQEMPSTWLRILSILLLALLTLLMGMLILKTMAAIRHRQICIEEG